MFVLLGVSDQGWTPAQRVRVRDVWAHQDVNPSMTLSAGLTANVVAKEGGVMMYCLTPIF